MYNIFDFIYLLASMACLFSAVPTPALTPDVVISEPAPGYIAPLPALTGDYRADFIAVAKSQLGYQEAEDGSSYFARWYDESKPNSAWCTEFVVWCAHQAGIPETVIPRVSSAAKLMDYYMSNGGFYYLYEGIDNAAYRSGDAETISLRSARPGDLLLKETDGDISNGPDHVAILLSYSYGMVTTLSGNYNDGVGIAHDSASKFHGVCRPAYDAAAADISLTDSSARSSGIMLTPTGTHWPAAATPVTTATPTTLTNEVVTTPPPQATNLPSTGGTPDSLDPLLDLISEYLFADDRTAYDLQEIAAYYRGSLRQLEYGDGLYAYIDTLSALQRGDYTYALIQAELLRDNEYFAPFRLYITEDSFRARYPAIRDAATLYEYVHGRYYESVDNYGAAGECYYASMGFFDSMDRYIALKTGVLIQDAGAVPAATPYTEPAAEEPVEDTAEAIADYTAEAAHDAAREYFAICDASGDEFAYIHMPYGYSNYYTDGRRGQSIFQYITGENLPIIEIHVVDSDSGSEAFWDEREYYEENGDDMYGDGFSFDMSYRYWYTDDADYDYFVCEWSDADTGEPVYGYFHGQILHGADAIEVASETWRISDMTFFELADGVMSAIRF